MSENGIGKQLLMVRDAPVARESGGQSWLLSNSLAAGIAWRYGAEMLGVPGTSGSADGDLTRHCLSTDDRLSVHGAKPT